MSETEIPRNGSYGLRGGKRIYQGYNDERKVKDRKKKEKKRLGDETFAKDYR